MRLHQKLWIALLLGSAALAAGCPVPTDATFAPEMPEHNDVAIQGRSQSALALEQQPQPETPIAVAATPSPDPAFVTTLSGVEEAGNSDGTLDNASYDAPGHIDFAGDDLFYLVDTGNHCVRKLDLANDEVTTVAGGDSGNADGSRDDAQFNRPSGIAYADGILFVADTGNHIIRRIDLAKEETDAGFVTTVAGDGKAGFFDGEAAQAEFKEPRGLAFDEYNNALYVADSGNHAIRRIDLTTNEVSTLAGDAPASDATESLDVEPDFQDDVATAARFSTPMDVAMPADGGYLYVADYGNRRIRKIDLVTLDVTTLAGDGNDGYLDGIGSGAQFRGPVALDVDLQGNVWVADRENNLIRKITPRGKVTTEAGTGAAGSTDGSVTEARLTRPAGIYALQKVVFTTDTQVRMVQFPQ